MHTFSAWTNRKAQNDKQVSENCTIDKCGKGKHADMGKIIPP